jgi:hypothetical protein
MPFSTLDKNWSNLASYYNPVDNGKFNSPGNVTFTTKPEYPRLRYTGFDDGFIRGGAINVGISVLRDTARIGKFLISPKGLLFIGKQFGLQRTNPQLEKAFTDKTNTNPTRFYSPLNTALQVPINALGGHIIRHGIRPIGGVGFLEGTSLNVNGFSYEFTTNYNNSFQSGVVLTEPNKNSNRLARLFSTAVKSPNGSIKLFDYNGGANSVYGLGKTSINTSNIRTTLGFFETTDENKFNNFKPFSSYRIADAKKWNINSELKFQLWDSPLYRNKINKSDGKSSNLGVSYDIESRIGVSSGKKWVDTKITPAVYDTVDSFTGDTETPFEVTPEIREKIYKYNVDSINVITVTDSTTFYGNSLLSNNDAKIPSWALAKGDQNIDGKFGRDIIKFRFEFLNNDNPVAGGAINTDVLAFRAYINEFSDGMNAKWDSYRYMGRGEEFYVYNGFTRDISLGFTIYAHSPQEMAPIYKKLNYLLSTFTPDYSAANKMRGNIGYLTVGDYLYRQPGVFTDIKLSGLLETHWEIALDSPEGGEGKDQYEVPKHINVNMSFKPIHSFLPRKAKYEKGESKRNTPFITVDKVAYPERAGQEKNKKGEIVKAATNKYLD